MGTTIQADPDELDRAANALNRMKDMLVSSSKGLRTTLSTMPRFRGQVADRFRQEIEALARTTQKQADEVGRQAESLKRLAREIREIRMR